MNIRTFAIVVASSLVLVPAQLSAAAECTPEAQEQAHELALFSSILTRIKSCSTAEGRAAYQQAVTAWAKLHEKDTELVRVCPATDGRFEYVHKTLKNLGSFYRAATRDC